MASRALFLVVLWLALATSTTTITATAAPTAPVPIWEQGSQGKALYQSELEQNLLLRNHLGYEFLAVHGLLRAPRWT